LEHRQWKQTIFQVCHHVFFGRYRKQLHTNSRLSSSKSNGAFRAPLAAINAARSGTLDTGHNPNTPIGRVRCLNNVLGMSTSPPHRTYRCTTANGRRCAFSVGAVAWRLAGILDQIMEISAAAHDAAVAVDPHLGPRL
jgi:hypothetical protein